MSGDRYQPGLFFQGRAGHGVGRGGAKPVEITIKGNENEISALVLAVQGRKNEQILDLTCGNSNNLIVENRKRIKTELCAILANNGHIF